MNIEITLNDNSNVSGLWLATSAPRACLVLAHGAGAGMAHSSMAALAEGLAARSILTLRFQFPFMERSSRLPDSPAMAHAAVRAAVATAARKAPRLPLFAGGKSFGGRMTSQAQALEPLPRVAGLVFFGFPLHPAGKPEKTTERTAHLAEVKLPMLFLQGTRDALAEMKLLRPMVKKLGKRATLALAPDADHAFHVPARMSAKSGRSDPEVLEALLDTAAAWMVSQAPLRRSRA